MRTLLRIIATRLDALVAKGVSGHLDAKRIAGGFWDRIVSAHHPGWQGPSRSLHVRVCGSDHTIVEYGASSPWERILRWRDVETDLVLMCGAHKVTLIEAYDPYFASLMALRVSRKAGVPWVVWVGSNDELTYRRTGQLPYPQLRSIRLHRMLARYCLRRAHGVWGGNLNNRDAALALGARPDRTDLVRDIGIDEIHFAPPPRDRRERGLCVVASRLSPEKRTGDAILAVKHASPMCPGLHLEVYGDGPERSDLEAMASRCGVKATFFGFVSAATLRSAYERAAAVLIPLGGSSLVEAALAEALIIAYRDEWHAEFIHEVTLQNGYLVNPTPRSMADALALVNAGLAYSSMGQTARRSAMLMFSPEAVKRQTAHAMDRARDVFLAERR